ncbi:MAG: transporter substrate-binding domain-containing protein [Herminiimonas sp.]|nr:transporter substrate-binding domain-containing protein [Herminiimonas sp.]
MIILIEVLLKVLHVFSLKLICKSRPPMLKNSGGDWARLIVPLVLACLYCTQTLALPDESQRNLVVGSEQDYPPFATGMTDATAGGFTVELWKAVAAESHLTYTIVVRPFRQLLQEFKEGKIDVLINLAQSNERRQYVDFTVPHVVVHGAIFVRKGEVGIHSESDLPDKALIVIDADLAHEYAKSKGWGNHLVLVATAAEGLRLLASGRHDAMLLNKLSGIQTVQAQKISNVIFLKSELGFKQQFSFATRKGQPELLYMLNEGLAATKSNGDYDELYNKWFGVYESKDVSWRDLLIYGTVIVVLFLATFAYFLQRRHFERKEAQRAVAASMNLLRTIIDTAPVRVFWKDSNLRFLGCNTAFAQDAGMTHPDQLIGKDDYQMQWKEQADLYRADDRAVITTGNSKLFYEEQQTTPDGRVIWVRTSKVAIKDLVNKTIGLLGVYEDITERKQLEDQVRQLAYNDVLTNLPNRRLLDDRLRQSIAASKRNRCHGAMLFLDLDNFKSLNDRHGHGAGDLLLQVVAERLKSSVREIDTVARIGGDEFVVILEGLHLDNIIATKVATDIAEKIRNSLAQPYFLAIGADGTEKLTIEHHCTASIGVMLFNGHDDSQEELLRWADAAMYKAKKDGGNCVTVHRSKDQN